jgi:hypothetical protein
MPEVLINQELMTGLVWENTVERAHENASRVKIVRFILKTLVLKWISFSFSRSKLVKPALTFPFFRHSFNPGETQIACQKEIPDQ